MSTKDKKFYAGITTDLKRRLLEHTKGLVLSTKFRRPFKLIHYEYFIDKQDAKAREVFNGLKSNFDVELKPYSNTALFHVYLLLLYQILAKCQ